MSCLVLSQWHQTCVLSSSHRMTSNKAPKDNGWSTLDTERTTSSPSFTEPSWSDVHFLLQLLSKSLDSPDSPLYVSWSGFCLTTHSDNNPSPPPLLSQPVRLHIYKLRLGLKLLLCALNNIHRPLFAVTLCKLFSSFIHFFFPFSQEKAISELLNIEKLEYDWGKMFSFSLPRI